MGICYEMFKAHPGDFVTLVPTCYSKALGWEFVTKCLRAQPGDFVKDNAQAPRPSYK